LGLNQVFLLRGLDFPVVKAYHAYQVDMAVLYGAERELAEKDMRDALEFEIALANVSFSFFFWKNKKEVEKTH
jgi:neprilysin